MSSRVATAPRIQRPSILGDDLRRLVNLTWTLAVTDWKLRFYGSVLGYVWTLARPFMLFGVIYVVFSEFAQLGDEVKNYALCILFGIVLFQFFGEATGGAVTSLVTRENLLRKMRFPRIVIPLSVALTALFNLGATLVAVSIFAITSGVYPTFGWLWIPVLVFFLLVLAVGLGMLLSALYVRYRDVSPIWDVIIQAGFYASPILYVATMVPESIQRPYVANPLATVLTQMRHAVVDPTAPSAAEAIGGAPRLLIPLGIVLGIFALGWYVFNREAPRIAENL